MIKTLLFPTDFTVASLNLVKLALSDLPADQQCRVVLLYGMHRHDSITELLFFSKVRTLADLCPPQFNEALEVLRNKFASKLLSIRKDLFSDYSQSAFDQYLEMNQIDVLYLAENSQHIKPKGRCFDLTPFFQKAQLPLVYLPDTQLRYLQGENQVAALFMNGKSAS